jgi:hypothetical protein
MTMTCQRCRMSLEPGWLCEEHAGQPWGHARCGAAVRAVRLQSHRPGPLAPGPV